MMANAPKVNSTIHRNNVYYLAIVIFQVEDELFKVPRYYFERHSEIFKSMFSLPPTVGQDTEGSADSVPLRLEGINKKDFEALLEVIYPLNGNFEATTDTSYGMPKSKWISVLKLATLWIFNELRAEAIRRLTSPEMALSPIEQVLLAKEYNVPQWLHSGYTVLLTRGEMLSLEDARQLTFQTAYLVGQAREEARDRKSQYNRNWTNVTDIIERVFKEELEEISVACPDKELFGNWE